MGTRASCQRAGGFIRGDVNADGKVNIADPIYLLNHLFRGGPPVPCVKAADANDDRTVCHDCPFADPDCCQEGFFSDAIYIIQYEFQHGPPPPAPFPNCGEDPTPDGLTCNAYPPCSP